MIFVGKVKHFVSLWELWRWRSEYLLQKHYRSICTHWLASCPVHTPLYPTDTGNSMDVSHVGTRSDSPLVWTVRSKVKSATNQSWLTLKNQYLEYERGSPEAPAPASGSYPGFAWQNCLCCEPKAWATFPLQCLNTETRWLWEYRHLLQCPINRYYFSLGFCLKSSGHFGLVCREREEGRLWACCESVRDGTCTASRMTS